MTDDEYVNAIIMTWLGDRDEKVPTPKIKKKTTIATKGNAK